VRGVSKVYKEGSGIGTLDGLSSMMNRLPLQIAAWSTGTDRSTNLACYYRTAPRTQFDYRINLIFSMLRCPRCAFKIYIIYTIITRYKDNDHIKCLVASTPRGFRPLFDLSRYIGNRYIVYRYRLHSSHCFISNAFILLRHVSRQSRSMPHPPSMMVIN